MCTGSMDVCELPWMCGAFCVTLCVREVGCEGVCIRVRVSRYVCVCMSVV